MVQEKNPQYKLQRTGASKQIFKILKRNIATGVWKVGDKIPSENELAAQFQVSRMTARNALQQLNALGLVETHAGEGSYVKEFRLSSYFGEVAELLDENHSINDTREFRKFFEAACLQLACLRRTDEDIEALTEAYQKMVKLAPTGNFTEFHNADMAFHRCICKIARNDVFLMVQYLLQDILRIQQESNSNLYGIVKGASQEPSDDNFVLKLLAADHEKYVIALREQNPSIAIDDLSKYLRQYEAMPD